MSLDQLKVMSAIERCRTAALGGHVARCENAACGHTLIAYNSCRNRHCPKCQAAASRRWLADREAELLPVPYFHVVYTLPGKLRDIAYQNKRVVYDLLMKAAAETTLAIAADPKRLGARIAITAVLHTWGSTLTHHPHVHMIVPGGGLSLDGARWVASRSNFLVHVNLLARLFSGKMLAMLTDAHDAGQLTFFNAHAGLADKKTFKRFIAPLRRIKWVVYCKAPFAGPKQVLRYLSRYTHRVAISNRRLIAADDAGVAFRWKDYRIDGPGRWKTMRLHPHEFIRRFLLHVLPKGFHRIRHMWTASWQVVFDVLIALVGCGHMSGLLVRYRTAGPDDIRQSWSLSLQRARARGGCQGVLGFRCDRVVHHVVALANLFETETPILESSVSSGLRVKFGSEGFAGRHHRPGDSGQLVGQGDGDDALGLPGPHGDDPFG